MTCSASYTSSSRAPCYYAALLHQLLHLRVFAKACVHAGDDGVSRVCVAAIRGDEEASDEGRLSEEGVT